MTHSSWTPAELLKISSSYWLSSALHAGVGLDVFTPLEERPRRAEELAAELKLSERGLSMLLDALVALELVEKSAQTYRNSVFSKTYLCRNSPHYLGHIIRHHHHLMGSWFRLEEAVRSGKPVRNRLSHEGIEQERESFLMGMFNLGMQMAPKIATQLNLEGRTRLLDLGGGPGTYAIHFCQKYPQLQATIFDLETTRSFAEKTVAQFNLQDRIDFTAGDFQHSPIPGRYDVAWLSHVLHGEGRSGCLNMLAATFEALEPEGQVLIQEFILEDSRDQPLFPALFSLNMLLGTPEGQAYSDQEIREMLTHAGFVDIEPLIVDLPNSAGVISAKRP
ncbi:MAG: SAM-dependent methyltransferase [Desulfuromonas sp.]|nr:MAG: SAM-dependent methyltransferase [Desulfuromonas sp.]